MMSLFRLTILLGITLMITQCQASSQPPPPLPENTPNIAAPATETEEDPVETLPPPTLTRIAPSPTPLPAVTPPILSGDPVQTAVKDLAVRLAIDIDTITLSDKYTEDLPGQNLGCNTPNQDKQPVQPGFVIGQVILLEAEGTIYEYHAHGRRVIYCGER